MSRLTDRLAGLGLPADHILAEAPDTRLTLGDALAIPPAAAGSGAALRISDPIALIRRLIAFDGQVDRLLLLAPGLPDDTSRTLMDRADVAVLATDETDADIPSARIADAVRTEWLMTTSGTTGIPKIVPHTVDSLTRSVRPPRAGIARPIWGLLYDPSRFAGMQVVLQSLLGGGTLLAPSLSLDLSERLDYLTRRGCTHLSATPSLWRKILMLPGSQALPLTQVTLGGEIADATLLRALAKRFPHARITHIYASTEIGVGFAVTDGEAGFPLSYLEEPVGGVALKVVEDELWARPPAGSSTRPPAHVIVDDEGFLCTGDRVSVQAGRVLFLGRASSTVNIGGVKVQVEDVEAIVAACPDVAECKVEAKPNPIVGAVLTLTVVPRDPAVDPATFRGIVKAWCREKLQREAQPATVKVADAIAISASGKLARVNI